jgi:hypothetical protein
MKLRDILESDFATVKHKYTRASYLKKAAMMRAMQCVERYLDVE